MNDRATVSSWTPADVAERDSDIGRDQYTSDPRTTDDLYEIICSNGLKDFLDDEELAAPLSQMVETLPKCIKEISEQMGRVNLPEYQAMLRLVAQVERILVNYVEGA